MRGALAALLAAVMVFGLLPGGAGAAERKSPKLDLASGAVSPAPQGLTGERGVGISLAGQGEYVPGEVIVRFKDGATTTQRSAATTKAGARNGERISRKVPGLMKAKLKPGVAVEDAIAAYERDPLVAYAQPNYRKRMLKTPNDTSFTQLWGMNNTGQSGGTVDADIDAPEAWDVTTGSSDIVVAVIDTGVDYNHPDLAGNMWVNPDEIPDNGIDDDFNGYVDDVHGADTVNSDGDPLDDNAHGTHCAGTIGGRGDDGLGVAGVNWNVKIMAVKILDAQGYGSTETAIKAFEYVQDQGVRIASNSWGGEYDFDQAEYDAIAAFDGLAVFAAGNNATNSDTTPFYPGAYNLANILTVGATDDDDVAADFSNTGATAVDVFAPGVGILSTVPAPLEDAATLFTDRFDSWANWDVLSYEVASKPWSLSGVRYVSASTAAGNVGYVNNQYETIELKTSKSLNLPAGGHYRLRGQAWLDLENGFDFLDIYAWSPSTGWVLIGYGTGDSGGFVPLDLDLSGLAGQSGVRLSFDVESDGSISSAQGWDGVWIDDLSVVSQQPGTDYSTAYDSYNGTSMATPHVSGVAALALSVRPDLTTAALKQAIMDSVDAKAGLSGLCVTGGRVNAAATLIDVLADVESGTLMGMVTSDGSPLSGATVKAGDRPAVTTAADGTYSIAGVPPGTYSVVYSKPGYYSQTVASLTVTADATTTQDVALAPMPGTVTGKVTSGGVAVAGATVKVGPYPSVTTASNGTYSVSGVAPGTYSATYSKSGHYSQTISGLVVAPGGTTTRNVSLAKKPGAVSGRLTHNGVGIGGATVKVGSRPTAYTNASGYYTVTGVPVGTYSVTYAKAGYVSKTLTGVSVVANATSTRNVSLARTVFTPSIKRSPTSSKLTYKRKGGVAKYKLSATIKGWMGTPLASRTVYLQTSKNGKSGWKNTYKLKTGSTGKVSKSFKIKSKGVRYYRWYVPAKSGVNNKVYASKQKVTIK